MVRTFFGVGGRKSVFLLYRQLIVSQWFFIDLLFYLGVVFPLGHKCTLTRLMCGSWRRYETCHDTYRYQSKALHFGNLWRPDFLRGYHHWAHHCCSEVVTKPDLQMFNHVPIYLLISPLKDLISFLPIHCNREIWYSLYGTWWWCKAFHTSAMALFL